MTMNEQAIATDFFVSLPEYKDTSSAKIPGFKIVNLPTKSNLLVYISDLGEQKTSGGIYLGAKTTEDECYLKTKGVLLDVAHNNKKDEANFSAQVKVGDTIHFRKYAGIHKVGQDDKAYRILQGNEIHSVELN